MSATRLLVLPRPNKRLLMLLGCIWSLGGTWDHLANSLVFIVGIINGSRFFVGTDCRSHVYQRIESIQ